MIEKGICKLAFAPIRKDAGSIYEMVSQLLYGETYTIIEQHNGWLKIKCDYDNYIGWISANQHSANDSGLSFNGICKNLIEQIHINNSIINITAGASVGGSINELNWENIYTQSSLYINAPYLWGGRSPFGIDCSGFTQVIYKSVGIKLLRDAEQQATQGQTIDFASTAKFGDLAFFDNTESKIIHVGMIWTDGQIIHANGKVRIDKFDQEGIYNIDTKSYSHKLRIIKRFF